MADEKFEELLRRLPTGEVDPFYVLEQAKRFGRSIVDVGDKVLLSEFKKGKDLGQIVRQIIGQRKNTIL